MWDVMQNVLAVRERNSNGVALTDTPKSSTGKSRSLTITNAQFTPLTGKCMMIRTTTFALRYEPTNSQTIGHYATQQNTA